MKLRNLLLALVCLLVFIAFGVVFFRTWVEQKPFGIILFVADGLSPNSLTAARLYQGGADHKLGIESFPHLALVKNYSNDFAVPDSAAAATAIATGVKGNNRAISVDSKGKELRSLLALARDSGRATGIITTGKLTDAAPAAFFAHTTDGRDLQSIAQQFVSNDGVDIALGGGLEDFTPESKGGARKDGRDLWLEVRSKGYTPVRTKAELESTPAFLNGPLIGLFADGAFSYSTQVEGATQQPSLSEMVRRGIEFLQTNRRGYLLVVDAALISRAASQNDSERVLTETIDFDNAVSTALKYAGEKTLIIAVGKHDVGGLSLNGYPLRGDHGVELLGTNAAGIPATTWSTGPNGTRAAEPQASPAVQSGTAATTGSAPTLPLPSPAVTGSPALSASAVTASTPTGTAPQKPTQNSKNEPAAFAAPEAINTARDMISIATGPGAESVNGFIDNTDVFKIIKKEL